MSTDPTPLSLHLLCIYWSISYLWYTCTSEEYLTRRHWTVKYLYLKKKLKRLKTSPKIEKKHLHSKHQRRTAKRRRSTNVKTNGTVQPNHQKTGYHKTHSQISKERGSNNMWQLQRNILLSVPSIVFCRVIIDRIRNGIEDKLRPVDILRNIRKIRRSLIRSIGSASEESWRYTDQTRYQISNYTIVQQRSHYQKQPKGDVGNG